jgi:YVTN family beta-propeller protein
VNGGRVTVCFACVYAAFLGCAPASGAEAFITDQTGDEVSVLDLGSKQVVAGIPVLGKPAGIAMAHDRRTAYVTSTQGKYVSVIDTVAQHRLEDCDSRYAARHCRRSGWPLYLRRRVLSAAPL